jgi:hypothetical protein
MVKFIEKKIVWPVSLVLSSLLNVLIACLTFIAATGIMWLMFCGPWYLVSTDEVQIVIMRKCFDAMAVLYGLVCAERMTARFRAFLNEVTFAWFSVGVYWLGGWCGHHEN